MARVTLKIGGLVAGGNCSIGRFNCLCSRCQAKRTPSRIPERPERHVAPTAPRAPKVAMPAIEPWTDVTRFDRALAKATRLYVRRPGDGLPWWFPLGSTWALTFDGHADLKAWMEEHDFVYDTEKNATRKSHETEVWLRSPRA